MELDNETFPFLPGEKFYAIRESFLTLCDGNSCAAALLNEFCEASRISAAAARLAERYASCQFEAGHSSSEPHRKKWICFTDKRLIDCLLGDYSRSAVRNAIRLLKTKGYIEQRTHPSERHGRKLYRVNDDKLEQDLDWYAAKQSTVHGRAMPPIGEK